MDDIRDIRQQHLFFAVLIAASIHAAGMTVYLTMVRPAAPVQPPPAIVLRSLPPPPAATLPAAPPSPQTALPAPERPIAAPAYDPALPAVTLRKAEETPVMEELETVIAPLPEPASPPKPEPLPEPKPQPLDLSQFEIPQIEPVPVPRPKPAPPQRQIAAAPVPPAAPQALRDAAAATAPQAAPDAATQTGVPRDGVPWPRHVEELSPIQRQQLLTEHYVDDKSNWKSWYASRDDAWRRLNMGFIDPTAERDHIEMSEGQTAYNRPSNWDPHEGPLSVQDLEEALEKMVAAGTTKWISRDVKAVKNLRYAERQRMLKKYFADDPRWKIGVVDPKAGDSVVMATLMPNGEEVGPITVQELEETLERLVQLGTQYIIGRNVDSARQLTYEERQDLLRKYYAKDPRWQVGIVDPSVPADHIEVGGEMSELQAPGYDEHETPLTIQEVEETLKSMLEKKLREQDGRHASPAAPAPR